jgi:hypothetical protein
MLKGLAFRLGFILCMAVVVRVSAAILGPNHPAPELVRLDDGSGGTFMVPTGLIAERGGEPVTSERMRMAIARVRQRNGGQMSGARLVFGSGYPNPVVTTPAELAQARADLRAMESSIDRQTRIIEREEREEADRPNQDVSFEPGKPMIDPTPHS